MDKNRILIIDDEKDLLEMLKLRLTHVGYIVECLDSGEKALEVARQFKPDLILLDIMMPQFDGYNVCYQIKHSADTAGAIVVLFTAQPQWSKEVSEGGKFACADDFIYKPFEARDLIMKIERLLKNRKST